MSDKMNALDRFGDRAEHYARYRPGWPREVLAFARDELGLKPEHVVADLGSGTGILSELFLSHGNVVHGVEPNAAMRRAAEEALGRHERFSSVEGAAEATGLERASVDYVVAGQAFHWFDPSATRTELERIARPGAYCLVLWNNRLLDANPFLRDYEEFLRDWAEDYKAVAARYDDTEALGVMLGAGRRKVSFPNYQELDREGLRGRVLSASYMPAPDSPESHAMLRALDALFDRHETSGKVRIDYSTDVYFARVTA